MNSTNYPTMRRGAVENAIKSDPFGGNALYAEIMRQGLYQKRYDQMMEAKQANQRYFAEQQGKEQQRIIDENTKLRLEYVKSLNGSPAYEASRSKKRRQQPARTLAYLR